VAAGVARPVCERGGGAPPLSPTALRAAGTERPEHAKGLLHVLLHLLMLGHVEVLEHVRRWAADADVSLVRYFVLQVRLALRLRHCEGCITGKTGACAIAPPYTTQAEISVSTAVQEEFWKHCNQPCAGVIVAAAVHCTHPSP